jgi:ribosomal protein L30E
VVPDVKRKLPGRGLWVTGTRSAIERAVKRTVFARGFKREVRAAADLADTVDQLLERAALDALAVAAKAGLVAAGFAKVEAALNKGEALALIHASDAAAEGRRKLKTPDDSGVVVIDDFSGARLDLALSRPNVVHAALLAGPGSETFLARVARLVRYRQNNSLDRGR